MESIQNTKITFLAYSLPMPHAIPPLSITTIYLAVCLFLPYPVESQLLQSISQVKASFQSAESPNQLTSPLPWNASAQHLASISHRQEAFPPFLVYIPYRHSHQISHRPLLIPAKTEVNQGSTPFFHAEGEQVASSLSMVASQHCPLKYIPIFK